ncbi:phospholipase D family protein [Pantoea agglomerans]|uniref:Uncharacterized protein n=1 Tax=Enterobacter agglomerans TaxID=549 RepID=A0ACC5RQI8_ENTAG|nr:phospholipase D family protein [Pantoea agglomerans]MBK4726976.1 hypothetical protein [Pantoea agglomerans]
MFLTSSDYQQAVTSLAADEEELLAAVAFWGKGADTMICPHAGQRARLICNVDSGATNPQVIKALRDKPGVTIRQSDKLHAKVIAGAKQALVGSANFSANGLNLEGSEQSWWDEAGLLTEDPGQIAAIHQWFAGQWEAARDISDKDLQLAQLRWSQRRSGRTASAPLTALERLRPADIEDRKIYLVIYNEAMSEDGEKAFQQEQKKRTCQPQTDITVLPPLYEGWPDLPTDALLIDLYYEEGRKMECAGIFTRTLQDINFTYSDGSAGHLALCVQEETVMGYPFDDKEARQFVKQIRPFIKKILQHATGSEKSRSVCIPFSEVLHICQPSR